MKLAQQLPSDGIDTTDNIVASSDTARKPYGNVIVLFKIGSYPITIGPDCTLINDLDHLFIPTLIGFTLSGYYIINLVNSYS